MERLGGILGSLAPLVFAKKGGWVRPYPSIGKRRKKKKKKKKRLDPNIQYVMYA